MNNMAKKHTLESSIRSFWAAGIIPLGRMVEVTTHLSPSSQTQRAHEDIQYRLHKESITVLSAHQNPFAFDMMAQAWVLAQLGVRDIVLPAAGSQYHNFLLSRALFPGLEKIPGLHIFPVYRAEERGKSDRTIQPMPISEEKMRAANKQYLEALSDFSNQPNTGILIAPFGTRRAIKNGRLSESARLREGVSSHLEKGFPFVVSTAAVQLLRGRIEVEFSQVQTFRGIQSNKIEASLKEQFSRMLR